MLSCIEFLERKLTICATTQQLSVTSGAYQKSLSPRDSRLTNLCAKEDRESHPGKSVPQSTHCFSAAGAQGLRFAKTRRCDRRRHESKAPVISTYRPKQSVTTRAPLGSVPDCSTATVNRRPADSNRARRENRLRPQRGLSCA